MSRIIDAAAVAQMLGCSTRTVEDCARDGTLPGTKFGDGWVFVDELVVDAVKRKSIQEAERRAKPARAKAVATGRGARHIPGFPGMSEHAVGKVLATK